MRHYVTRDEIRFARRYKITIRQAQRIVQDIVFIITTLKAIGLNKRIYHVCSLYVLAKYDFHISIKRIQYLMRSLRDSYEKGEEKAFGGIKVVSDEEYGKYRIKRHMLRGPVVPREVEVAKSTYATTRKPYTRQKREDKPVQTRYEFVGMDAQDKPGSGAEDTREPSESDGRGDDQPHPVEGDGESA